MFDILNFSHAGERTQFEEFAFQHAEPGSHCNFTAVANVNITSRTQNSTQVGFLYTEL